MGFPVLDAGLWARRRTCLSGNLHGMGRADVHASTLLRSALLSLGVPFTGLWMVDKIRPDLADVRVFIDTHPDRSVNRDNVTLWLGLHQLGCVISPRVGQPSIEPRHENLIERFPSQTRCSKSRSRPAV